MLAPIRLRPIITRQFCTSPQLGFKFKLTEELSKAFEEKQKAKQKPPPEPALHTKLNSLIMGRVSHERYKKVVKVAIPKHRLNEYFLLYIRESDNVQALDDNDVCKPGDWVLLRRDEELPDQKVRHRVERVVYSYGKYIDPLTGRRSLGIYFDDDMDRLEKIKIEL